MNDEQTEVSQQPRREEQLKRVAGNQLEHIIADISHKWQPELVRLETAEPPVAKDDARVTEADRVTLITGALALAKAAITESVYNNNFTLEGGWTSNMDAIVNGITAEEIIAGDADVLQFLVRFLERAQEKYDISKSERQPFSSKAIFDQLARCSETAQAIRDTYNLEYASGFQYFLPEQKGVYGERKRMRYPNADENG